MNPDWAIDVDGLSKSFAGKPAVIDVKLKIKKGEILGFLGPNGSGKTTTIRMLCGLLTPDAGTGHCLGHDITREAAAIKREVGYMTQHFSLYQDLSIEENLDFIARVYQMRDRRVALEALVEDFGFQDRRQQLVGTLSGGWQQRLALAAALLHRPKLLLLDEPTAGIDPMARRTFWDRLHRLAEAGMTTLVSTHYMDEAERCHRLAYIAYGRILVCDSAQRIIQNSGLVTWWVTGREDTHALAERLRQTPAVEQVVAYGAVLHVSGRDAAGLEQALLSLGIDRANYKRGAPNLEDVFIHLIGPKRGEG